MAGFVLTTRQYVYTYPSRKAVNAVTGGIRTLSRQVDTNHPLDVFLRQVNSALKGWCAYCVPRGRARFVREEVRLAM